MDNEIAANAKMELATNASHTTEPNSNFIETFSKVVEPNSTFIGPNSNVTEPNSNLVGTSIKIAEPSIIDSKLVNSNIDLINNDLKDMKLPKSIEMDVDMAEINSSTKSGNKETNETLLTIDKNPTRVVYSTIVEPNKEVDEVIAVEVVEEVLIKTKATGRTGEDDLLIKEWKKSEAKQGDNVNKKIGPSTKDRGNKGDIESLLFDDIVFDAAIPKTKKKLDDIDTKIMEEMLDDWADYGKEGISMTTSEPMKHSEESEMVAEKKKEVESGLMEETIVDLTEEEKKEKINIVQEGTTSIHESKEDPKLSKSGVKKRKLSSKKSAKDSNLNQMSGKTSQPSSDDPKAEERRHKIEERMKKREEKLMKEKSDMKKHQQQLSSAMKRLLPEEANDSGVDENTQSKETNDLQPIKNGKISQVKKRQPRSVDPSPMKPRNPQSAASLERNIPMNKIEVGKTASPNIKNVRSKIGSLNNSTYKPGGGNVKIESKKLDFSKASSRIAAKNEAYSPGGGDKKIESQKLKWNANSKIGSLEKKDHKPGGGDKKVQTQKLNFKETAHSKVGSKDNLKHKAGGGDIEIATEKIDFKVKASSKVGSLDNVKHKAGGGDKKIYDDKEYLKQMQTTSSNPTSSGRASGAISPATTGTNSPGPQEEDESQSQKDE